VLGSDSIHGDEGIRRLRRTEYEQLAALGCFEGERVELIEGLLVSMSPQSPRHTFAIRRLTHILVRAVGERADVQVQGPLVVSDVSEPEPDVALVTRGLRSEHATRAFLVIEVADSSLRRDREIKARLYASIGVPEYWIVNLTDGTIEVSTEPSSAGYGRVTSHGRGDTLRLVAFPDITVAVDDIL
jgi:Uma2 family endonuclease